MKRIYIILAVIAAVTLGLALVGRGNAANSVIPNTTLRYVVSRCDTNTVSAPGYFTPHLCTGYSQVQFTVKLSKIGTSATLKFWGAIKNGLGRFPLDADNDSLVVGANGTISRLYNSACIDTVIVQLLSEAGGDSTIATELTVLGTPYK